MNRSRWSRIALGLLTAAAVLMSASTVLAYWPTCGAEAGMQEARENPCTVVVLAQGKVQGQPTETEAELTLVAATFPDPLLVSPVPNGLSYSPDGTRLVTAMIANTPIVWDVTTGEQIFELDGHTSVARATAWSPDGAIIAGGSDDGTVILWNADTGEVLHTLNAHFMWANGVAFSPDSRRLASTSAIDNQLRIWDVATGELLSSSELGLAPNFVVWSPDGAQIAVSSMADETGGKVFVFDADSGELVLETMVPGSNTAGIAYSPDGTRLLSAAFQAQVAQEWDAITGERLLELSGHTQPVVWVAYSPDGTLIATNSWDGARLWDAATGEELLALVGSPDGTPRAEFSPDGTHLATIQMDGTARIYNLQELLGK